MREAMPKTRDIARELSRKYSTMTFDELDVLTDILVPMKYAKGDKIVSEGEVCQYIYYIEKGLIRQFYYKNGKEVTEYLGVEHMICMCIESLFKEEPTHLQMEALEPTLLYALPKNRLEATAMRNVNMQMLYRKILEESLIISQVRADMLRFESAQNRYKLMCELTPQIVLRAPLNYIANYLQMTPETLSRVRSTTLT